MGTDYRDTGSERGDFEFDDELEAQIGQPTKASQYNYMEENSNFLFMSCMHGRRGQNQDTLDKMYECESGRIWAVGRFTAGSSENPSQLKIFETIGPEDPNTSIPWNLTGRILTAHVRALAIDEDVSDSELAKFLPGGEREAELWQAAPGSFSEMFENRGADGGGSSQIMMYTGPGRDGDDYRLEWNWQYVSFSPAFIDTCYLRLYVDPSNHDLYLQFYYQLHQDSTVSGYKCVFVIDIAYSPRIPYYNEE